MQIINRTLSLLFLSTAVIAGCASEEDEVSTQEEGLLQSPVGPTIAASVQFSMPGGLWCTGTVLSDHWILTAAHCVQGQTGTPTFDVRGADSAGNPTTYVYNGRVELFSHPSWGGSVDTDVAYDIALIHTLDRAVNFAPRGNLFSDTAHQPWYGNTILNGWVEGFGYGTNPGGANDCSVGTPNILRRAQYRPEGSGSTIAISSQRIHCGGDSGGPWLFWLADSQLRMVQYAVHHGFTWGYLVGGSWFSTYDTSAAVAPAIPWIESTMILHAPAVRLSVTDGIASGYHYHAYSEQPLATLHVGLVGTGTVTTQPDAGTCSTSPCTFRYVPGTAVALTASGGAGFAFSSWSGCANVSGNQCYVTPYGDLSLSATFTVASCYVDTACRNSCTHGCGGDPDCIAECIDECRVCP